MRADSYTGRFVDYVTFVSQYFSQVASLTQPENLLRNSHLACLLTCFRKYKKHNGVRLKLLGIAPLIYCMFSSCNFLLSTAASCA